MAAKIFINYRRDDSTGTAGRLHDRLAQSFGRKNLFMDVDHIPPGVDFINHLNAQVAGCDVFLVIIGPTWLEVSNEKGERRLDDPGDFVAIEIATALARNIRVIPVLVDGARMPMASELPESLKPLVRRQAIDVRNTHFGRDAEALIEKIGEKLSDNCATLSRWRVGAMAGAIAALLIAGWIALSGIVLLTSTPSTVQPDTRREAERERPVADETEQDRKAKAESEERRNSEEAERRRLAEEEEHKRAEEEVQARYRALVNQAEADVKARNYDKAIANLSQAIDLDPKRALAVNKRAGAYLKKGDNERALVDINDALRLDPNYAPAFSNRGLAYRGLGDTDRALADLNHAIRLDPDYAPAFYNRGLVYRSIGDRDRALASFNEAIRLDPNSASFFNDRGLAYMNRGYIERAIADFDQAIRLNPTLARAFCNRGMAKLSIKDASSRADIAKARQLSVPCTIP